jgi:tetratricopeptide (TPR) repeat protein
VIVTGPGTELERLRARVAVLEATNVPYTAEELALLKAAPTVPVPAPPAGVKELPPSAVVMPAAMKEPSPPAHAAANLSAAAIALLEDGRLDVKAKHYDAAEKKFLEVLHENPNNLFVLCALATVQYDAGHLDDCEKSVRRALERDPDDAGSLYMFGVLRNTQGKLDEALDALSRSAGINSTNAATQFYLGTVLAAKGMRPQAETALRKAVVLEPDYGDAHFALATIYAAETPPMVALARSHYQKALDQHHPKDEKLEKLISGGD